MNYRFQRRCWWQASSLNEQIRLITTATATGHIEPPKIKYVMSSHESDPYLVEWTPKFASAFPNIEVVQQVWSSDEFGLRGHIRTRNLLEETAEFILFVDGDMIYEPAYFAKMIARMEALRGDHRVVAAPRLCTEFEDGYHIIDRDIYGSPVVDGYAFVESNYKLRPTRTSGAGFFQLIHVPSVREYMLKTYGSVWYAPPQGGRDINILKVMDHRTRSDRAFRIAVGGIIAAPELINQIHLNHYRAKDPQWAQHPQH
jgi:hypothetical protein